MRAVSNKTRMEIGLSPRDDGEQFLYKITFKYDKLRFFSRKFYIQFFGRFNSRFERDKKK